MLRDLTYIENTAKILMKEGQRIVHIELHTSIENKRALEVLLSRTLRAASLTERDVYCMTEKELAKAYSELGKMTELHLPTAE